MVIVFPPKRMLRHPKAVSTMQDLVTGSFHELMWDTAQLDANRVDRVVFSSGQIYYDLAAAREEQKAYNVALLRLEQIYPFPAAEIEDALAAYPSDAEVVWAQEEPRNMGAWRTVQEWIGPLLEATHRVARYVGRAESASPAAGSLKRHQQEQAELVRSVFAAGSTRELEGLHLVGGRS